METSTKKELSDALKNALKDEHLWTHQAATLLNLNPQYISMMLNPNSFEKCGITAWSRVEDWFNTKDTLYSYKFPADEPVWKPKEKAEDKDYNIQAPKKAKGVPKMKSMPPPPPKQQEEIKPVSKELVTAVLENLQNKEEKKINGETSGAIQAQPGVVIDFSLTERDSLIKENSELENRMDLMIQKNYDLVSECQQLSEENSKLQNIIAVSKSNNDRTIQRKTSLSDQAIINQKIALDIEINLLVCGQKIQIKL